MIFTNVKAIFEEKIHEIIVFLCIIYAITKVTAYILKWIHPCLKRWTNMNCSEENSGKYKTYSRHTKKCDCIIFNHQEIKNNASTDKNSFYDEVLKVFEHSSSYVCAFPQIFQPKPEILNRAAAEVETLQYIAELKKQSIINGKKCCEAQTNITISPQLKIDCSRPSQNLIFTCVPSKNSFESSSDNFESASSSSNSIADFPTLHHLTCCELFNRNRMYIDSLVEKIKHKDVKKQVDKLFVKDNKLLEMAIMKFEKEMMPIKYEIKELKEYLYNVKDLEKSSRSFKNTTLLTSCSESQSEGFSPTASTTCSVGPNTFSSSALVLQNKMGSLRNKITLDSKTRPVPKNHTSNEVDFEISKNRESPRNRDSTNQLAFSISKQSNSHKKHSPLAEMHIKLSNCNSQFPIYIEHSKIRQKDKNAKKQSLTYEINLNFSIEGISATNRPTHRECQLEVCAMSPVLSEPEDILRKLSNTHIVFSGSQI